MTTPTSGTGARLVTVIEIIPLSPGATRPGFVCTTSSGGCTVGVAVGEGVTVEVTVDVTVGDGVSVAVPVAVAVAVIDAVAVVDAVNVAVAVAEAVGVAVAGQPRRALVTAATSSAIETAPSSSRSAAVQVCTDAAPSAMFTPTTSSLIATT